MNKISVLLENTCRKDDGFLTDHGLSLFVETNEASFLFDSGPSNLFMLNAEKLGVDLKNVPLIILSHAHYDHTGGLKHLLDINFCAKIYLKKECLDNNLYAVRKNEEKFIGFHNNVLNIDASRFLFVAIKTEVLPNVWILPQIENAFPQPKANAVLQKLENDKFVKDDFCHEQIVVVETVEGLVILSGCSHSGILNILKTVIDNFPERNISLLVGGFHLTDSNDYVTTETEEEIDYISLELLKMAPHCVFYTGHCTSQRVIERMKFIMGERLCAFQTGDVIFNS